MTGSENKEPDTLHDAVCMAVRDLGISFGYADFFAGVRAGTTKALKSPRNVHAQAVCEALGIDRFEFDRRGWRKEAPPDEEIL